jgi:hypothetical protein
VDIGLDTVVSTRILRPSVTPVSCAIITILWWICLPTSSPTAKHQRPMVLASGVLAPPTRVKSRYTHFALRRAITPVADVHEDHATPFRPERPAGRGCDSWGRRFARASYPAAIFAKIAYFLGDQPVVEAELRSAHLNHASSSRPSAWPHPGAAGRVGVRKSPRSPQLLVIVQPAAARQDAPGHARPAFSTWGRFALRGLYWRRDVA